MNRERMTQFLRVLNEVKKEGGKLSIDQWLDGSCDPMDRSIAASPMTWACRDEWMRKQGLYVWQKRLEDASVLWVPSYGSLDGVQAISEFFDITDDEAARIEDALLYVYSPDTNDIDVIISYVEYLLTKYS